MISRLIQLKTTLAIRRRARVSGRLFSLRTRTRNRRITLPPNSVQSNDRSGFGYRLPFKRAYACKSQRWPPHHVFPDGLLIENRSDYKKPRLRSIVAIPSSPSRRYTMRQREKHFQLYTFRLCYGEKFTVRRRRRAAGDDVRGPNQFFGSLNRETALCGERG